MKISVFFKAIIEASQFLYNLRNNNNNNKKQLEVHLNGFRFKEIQITEEESLLDFQRSSVLLCIR